MAEPIPAAIAFFAFGALFLGSVLLLLFNPRSRGVRWFVVFQAANMVWLALQGWAFAAGAWDAVGGVVDGTVHLLPALFLAFTLAHRADARPAGPWLAVALGVVMLPLSVGAATADVRGWLVPAWHVAVWGAATLLLTRGMLRTAGAGAASAGTRRLGRAVALMLAAVAPIVLLGAALVGVRTFHFAMPLLVVWIQLVVFVGVAHLRYYDIEIRAARSGELAAGAAEAERLAVVGELTATLAHEIRNPLTGVRSLAQRLAEDDVDPQRRRRYAGVILEEVGRLERLVTNLLGLVPRTAPTAAAGARTPLAPLFDDLLLLLGPRAEAARVRLEADAGGLVAPAPREPLAQALINLLLNAIRHSPANGTVRLLASGEDGEVVLRVRDRGPGIPAAERGRIWQPLQGSAGGTGLGLAVVRRLARENDWDVGVEDAPGGGSEFRIRVTPPATRPAGSETPAAVADAARASAP